MDKSLVYHRILPPRLAPEHFLLANFSKYRMVHHDLPLWAQYIMQWGGLLWCFTWFGGAIWIRNHNTNLIELDSSQDKTMALSGYYESTRGGSERDYPVR